MIADSTIELIPPSLELVDEVRDALIESYDLHQLYLAWTKPKPTKEEVTANMEQAARNFVDRIEELRFFIKRLSDSRIVGCIGLIIRNMEIPYFEIGYWARAADAGNGHVTAAVNLLEKYAVETLGARRLEIRMADSNIASRRVAEKAGYDFEAMIHGDRRLRNGHVENTLVFYKLFPASKE